MLKAHTVAILVLVGAQLANADLSNRMRTHIQRQIAPAYFRGDSAETLKLLTRLIEKLDPSELAEVDALLAEEDAPGIGKLLLDARMTSVLRGDRKKPATPALEAALTLPLLRDRVDLILTEVDEIDGFNGTLPEYETLKGYRDLFWEIHVSTNRLLNAARMAKFGHGHLENGLDTSLKKLSDDQLASFDIDFETRVEDIARAGRELKELQAEIRIRAVTKAAKVLQESKDLAERFEAAHVVDFDGEQVVKFLQEESRDEFHRPALRDPDIAKTVDAYVKLSRDSAGDLIEKSRLLHLGMHWWMRGRYGAGPDGFGLLKCVESLLSPAMQFPLFMPTHSPTPTNPLDTGYKIPTFERRHHYIWMYEYRRLQLRKTFTEYETQSRTVLSNFY